MLFAELRQELSITLDEAIVAAAGRRQGDDDGELSTSVIGGRDVERIAHLAAGFLEIVRPTLDATLGG